MFRECLSVVYELIKLWVEREMVGEWVIFAGLSENEDLNFIQTLVFIVKDFL